MELTERQKRFCDEYIISGNASDAARKAGYSVKTARIIATENLSKPSIIEYIKNKTAEVEEEKVASALEVLQFITSIMRDPNEDTASRIKCAELMGKRHVLFSDKVSVEGIAPVVIYGADMLED